MTLPVLVQAVDDRKVAAGSLDSSVPAPALRVAVICAGEVVPFWQAETIRNLLDVEGVTLACVLIEQGSAEPLLRYRKREASLWRYYRRLAHRFRASASLRPVNLAEVAGNRPRLLARTTRQSARRVFARSDLHEIVRLNLDVIIDFGDAPATGEVLAAARYGVWSFQPGHGQSGPIGFWELYRNAPFSSVTLQRLGPEATHAFVIRESAVKTVVESFTRNADHLLLGVTAWPAAAARLLRVGQASEVFRDGVPQTVESADLPTNRVTAGHLCKLARNHVRQQAQDLFGYSESGPDEWAIGVSRQSVTSLLAQNATSPVRWVVAPEGRYYADPFVLTRGRTSYIFVEDYCRRDRRGHIAVIETDDFQTFGPARAVIQQPFHLSYPCVFVHADRCYCVPEQHQSGEVAIYEAVDFPDRWTKRATLLRGFAGVDPTVFRHGGRWWMFLTNRANEDVSHLYLFMADHPLGPWIPHPRNPVKSNRHKVRPAGMPLPLHGWLVRPAQDCSRTYGGRLELHRITRLTTIDFEEELLGTIDARAEWPFAAGMHTINVAGGVTIFDAKRRMTVRNDLRRALRRKTGTVLAASGLRGRRAR
jgi:hypothetical protein